MRQSFPSIFVLIFIIFTISCGSPRHSVRHTSAKYTRSTTKPSKIIDYPSMRSHMEGIHADDVTVGKLLDEAKRWIGTPYRYAGNSLDGTDCSGFVSEVYKSALSIKLPRSSCDQQKWCIPVENDSITVGDLLFFATGSDANRVSHVGIYIGNEEMIHASSSNGVIISQLNLPYYRNRFHSAGRVCGLNRNITYSAHNTSSKVVKTIVKPVICEKEPVFEREMQVTAAIDSVFIDFFD